MFISIVIVAYSEYRLTFFDTSSKHLSILSFSIIYIIANLRQHIVFGTIQDIYYFNCVSIDNNAV